MEPEKEQVELPQRALTREQRRKNERATEEAKAQYEAFCEKFLIFFTNADDPTGHEVLAKRQQLSRQWRLYCDRKGLLPAAYTIVDEFMMRLVDQYNNDFKPAEPVADPEPEMKVDEGNV